MVRRHARAFVMAILAAMSIVSCGTGGDPEAPVASGPPSGTTTAGADEGWDLVVLADSSGWGIAEAWARRIRHDEGVRVEATDLAVGMYSGVRLLEDLRTRGSAQREAVAEAEVISVWVNPMSLDWTVDSDRCVFDPTSPDPPTHLTKEDFAPYAALWRDVLAEVNALRAGLPTAVRTRDIYNAGVADHLAAGTAEECTKNFRMTTAIVKEATRLAGATFVPVYATMNGPDRMQDPRARGLLRDPEHLSARGVSLMVDALDAAGYAELTDK